ncbi:MAG: sodium/proline symporter, partial [Cyclobacteriaceae bacterium]|nr:sodium/proline symporter [Cyclobacteriaceae bacterium]
QIDPALTNIFGAGGFNTYNLFTIIGYAVIGLGFMGSPQVFVRFMSIKDQSEITKGRWVALIFTVLTDTAAVCIGILGRYLFTESGTDVQGVLGNGAQNVLPMSVESLLPLALEATYIAVVLAAIMSTIDSLLVVGSSAITHDFDQKIFRRPRKNLARHSRNVTLGMAIVALLIALTVSVLSPTRTIFWFVIFGWSGIAATFCPVIILSLLWKEYNESGALASMITGFLSVPLFKFGATSLPEVGVYFIQVAELMPSFVLAILVGILVTKFTNS